MTTEDCAIKLKLSFYFISVNSFFLTVVIFFGTIKRVLYHALLYIPLRKPIHINIPSISHGTIQLGKLSIKKSKVSAAKVLAKQGQYPIKCSHSLEAIELSEKSSGFSQSGDH